MKYVILVLGIIAVIFVTFLNFFPDTAKELIYNTFNRKEYILAKPNDYYIESDFKYIKNYTDDVSNKEELLEYIYYVINTGSEYADGECTKSYTSCIDDINSIAKDQDTLSLMNNFVHPFNSFKTISFTYNEHGEFSVSVEHIYSKEDIAAINFTVDNQIKLLITDNLTTEEKIRNVHNYIIDNTKYDTLKSEDIDDDTYRSNTAYGVLFQGYGICSGYADTMAIFLDKLGIVNYKISNDTHIWNLIYINGKWVHLDATWDDPISEFNENRDTYFLIDYNELLSLDDDTHSFDKNIFMEAY